MKKWVSGMLAFVFLLSPVLSAVPARPALADGETGEFFESFVEDGVTYYDMLGSTPSSMGKGWEKFCLDYLQTQTKQGTTYYPSVLELWAQIAEAIVDGATEGIWAEVKRSRDSDGNVDWSKGVVSGSGSAKSIAKAASAALGKIDAGRGGDLMDTRHFSPEGLSDEDNLCVYYYKAPAAAGVSGSSLPSDGAYAVILSNLRYAKVVSDQYIEGSIMNRPDYKLTEDTPTSSFAQHFTNETEQTAQASAALTTEVTESVSISSSHTDTKSYSHTLTFGAKLTFGTKEDFLGGELSGSYSHTWGTVASDTDGKSTTHSEKTAHSLTLSAALPPFTEEYIITSQGKGTMKIYIDLPVMLIYDVTIVYFAYPRGASGSDIDNLKNARVFYTASELRGSTDARFDLYQRVLNGSTEPDGVNNSYNKLRETARKLYYAVPLCKSSYYLSYGVDYATHRLSSVRPMRNLKKVELKDKRSNLALKVGEPLDVSTVEVVGLNDKDQPFFGFDDALGSWILLDTDGKPIKDNANEFMKLERDAITGKLTLTALAPGGSAVLKYVVPENTYLDVVMTPADAEPKDYVYINPSVVDNEATLIVKTTSDAGSYSIVAEVAEGGVLGYIGDEAIALNGKNSPVEAYALDGEGLETTVPITWKAQLSNGTIAIDDENNLTFLAPGENKIRAQWGSVRSDWLDVTVRAAREATTLELSDPKEVLKNWHMSVDGNSRAYDLDLLTLLCKDQYGDAMPVPEDVVWLVAKDGEEAAAVEDPHAFTVTESGDYSIHAETQDGAAASNALTLSVGEAPHLASLAIQDNKLPPLLGNYKFCSGTNQFDLWDLTVISRDQYDEPFAGADFAWYVSDGESGDQKLDGHVLTVGKVGTYQIYAGAMSGDTRITSEPLSLNVTSSVTGVRLNKSALTLPIGKTERLTAYAEPNGEVDEYTWYSSDESAVTVGADGLVTAVAPTEEPVTVTARGGSGFYAECQVTVREAAALDTIVIADDPDNPLLSDYILHDGDDTFDLSQLVITGIDQYDEPIDVDPAKLTWSVSGQDLEGAVLTVNAVGSYRISCRETAGTAKSNALMLTVKEARHLAGLTIADSAVAPVLGDYVLCSGTDEFDLNQLTVSAVDQYGSEASYDALTWYANGEPLEDGLLTVRQVGEYKVGAKAEQGDYTVESDTLTLNVTSNVTGILLEPDPVRLAAGKTAKLTASALPAGEKDLYTWYSSNESIFTVDGEGNVTAVAPGIGTLTVRGGSGEEATCTVEVLEPARLTKLTLADDPYQPLLADYCLHDADDTFLLTLLTISGTDQYGDPIAVDSEELTWVVNGKAIEGAALKVEDPGDYDISCFRANEDGTVQSENTLTLKVLDARRLYSLTIANSSPWQLFPEEYRLGSGTDSFDLLNLSISAEDEYGRSCPFDTLIWYVNGKELVGDILRVDKVGTYTIQAEAWQGDLIVDSNILTLNVVTRVTGIRLGFETYTLSAGETVQLSAAALPEGEPDTYAFESSRPSVASVDADGTITAIAAGQATITVTSGANPDVHEKCAVTVVNPPESLALSPREILLTEGGTELIAAIVSPDGAPTTITYTSGDDAVATVSASGVVTGVAAGTTYIRAETHNGRFDICYVEVVPQAMGIDAPDELVLGVDETYPLGDHVELQSRGLALIGYRSMDPKIATVDADGKVTALQRGKTAIIVTGPGNLTKQVPLTVKYAPGWVDVSPNVIKLNAGDQQKIEAILPDGSAGAVTFVPKDMRIAVVSEDGVVTALSKGETVITVSTYNGRMAACTVYSEGVTPESRALRLPAALKAIGAGAFTGNPAQVVFLPDGAAVKAGAFTGCEDLHVVVTKDASGIEEGAFDHEVKIVEELN